MKLPVKPDKVHLQRPRFTSMHTFKASENHADVPLSCNALLFCLFKPPSNPSDSLTQTRQKNAFWWHWHQHRIDEEGCCLQDLFLGVDGLSPVQWHPYSTVGSGEGHTLVAHIKAYGK